MQVAEHGDWLSRAENIKQSRPVLGRRRLLRVLGLLERLFDGSRSSAPEPSRVAV
jgi:hypothetical protein